MLLMSSVLVACGGGTGASLSTTTTTTTTTPTGSNSNTTTNNNTGTSTATTGDSSTATGNTTTSGARLLTRNVVDAAYSDALERLITVSSLPDNALTLINPATGEQQAVVLTLTPTSVAISPDGKTAVVGHNNAVTQVNLQTASVTNSHNNLNMSVFDLALDAQGIAYATPKTNEIAGALKSINLNTGLVTASLSVVQAGSFYLQLAPNLKALYLLDKGAQPVDLAKADASITPPAWLYDSPYNGDHDIGGATGKGLWLSEDEAYLLTAGETLFRTANTQDQDMLYQRSLSDNDNDPTTTLLHADHSQEAGKFVVILDKGIAGVNTDYRLKTYTAPQLVVSDEQKLSTMNLNNSSNPVIPQFVFFNSDGSKRYALLKQGTETYLLTF
ncbi:YncE family protein [Thiothrix subterranea]|nr:hypothetical protein [Thiothrix subterranea]MDQ5768517.1 hypothetical protein [Thiothrix subterranea]